MSIILKGIDIPETNEIRMIAIKSNGEVFFNTVKDGTPDKTKMSRAIQIPKKHGRLKDFDGDGIHPIIIDGVYMVKVDDLAEIPTILEAEE